MNHKATSKHPPQPHPYMLAFCGYSGSGKTTLITRLIGALKSKYAVAYIKHDAHKFTLDKKGKDTYKAKEAGAERILINDPHHSGMITGSSPDHWDDNSNLESADIVLVEGYKNSSLPKILVLDKSDELLQKYRNGEFEQVAGIVYCDRPAEILGGPPQFHRDDVDGICDRVTNIFSEKAASLHLYGLVLDGGRSTRMGKDKGSLEYYGKPHHLYLAELLSEKCDGVFISRRSEQVTTGELYGFKEIPDSFTGMGPLGGILSAQKEYPQAAFLVLACDLPFVNKQILNKLLEQRNPFKFATVFKSADNKLPEPLCAVYEPKFYGRALKFVSQGFTCPRKVLLNSKTELLDQGDFNVLYNANSPEDLEYTLGRLKKEKV